MKEETIALFKQKGTRLQLVKIKTENTHFNQYHIPVGSLIYFQIRENRKILETLTFEDIAKKRYLNYIAAKINQLSIY